MEHSPQVISDFKLQGSRNACEVMDAIYRRMEEKAYCTESEMLPPTTGPGVSPFCSEE